MKHKYLARIMTMNLENNWMLNKLWDFRAVKCFLNPTHTHSIFRNSRFNGCQRWREAAIFILISDFIFCNLIEYSTRLASGDDEVSWECLCMVGVERKLRSFSTDLNSWVICILYVESFPSAENGKGKGKSRANKFSLFAHTYKNWKERDLLDSKEKKTLRFYQHKRKNHFSSFP